jgi:LysR family transcriptional regulator, glycine cleavage system transcriptional activator
MLHVSMNLLHTTCMRSLPPFDGLVAFEASARHRSMTLAAQELRLTQSAISHRLKKLETFVGTPLLDRSRTGLEPTPAGAALREEIVKLLDEMTDFRARSRAAARPAALRVGAGHALMHYWLIRRLPRFTAANPGITISIIDASTDAQARAADVDVQIIWLQRIAARATSTQRLLFEENVFPVAAPQLLPQGSPLADLTTLARLPIIHKGPAGRNDGAEWSWPAWFGRLGLEAKVPDGLRFDTISNALAGALEGTGVALGRSLLVHDALAEGRLVRVLPTKWDMASSKVHVVRWPAVLAGDARVARFTDWLEHEVSVMQDA